MSAPDFFGYFWRFTILAHRYVGITISLVILLWCLSGVVMMYVQYPALEKEERLAGLDRISFSDAQQWQVASVNENLVVSRFAVEATPRGTVLRYSNAAGELRVLSLESGDLRGDPKIEQLDSVAEFFAVNRGWSSPYPGVEIKRDQWTVQGRFDPYRPLLKYANEDGFEWYVSRQTGEVVQATSKKERYWNWFGSVVHWVYPTVLRQHVTAWAQTVIWLSLLGLFLTITGVVIGVRQFRKRQNGRRSPYRGFALWHHYAGLVFGTLTLTWLLSGLFSMTPWGLLESGSADAEREILNGGNVSLGAAIELLQSSSAYVPDGIVRIESVTWLGVLYLVAYDGAGNQTRVSADGVVGGLAPGDAELAALQLRDETATVDLLTTEDAYYYNHHTEREFPVYRIAYTSGEYFYISAISGVLLKTVDSNARWYRWLFNALHSGDFNAAVRSRPAWDFLMLLLLLGVTAGVASGTWLGFKRIVH
jgi:uncharacterized iron-regulated membrane protein